MAAFTKCARPETVTKWKVSASTQWSETWHLVRNVIKFYSISNILGIQLRTVDWDTIKFWTLLDPLIWNRQPRPQYAFTKGLEKIQTTDYIGVSTICFEIGPIWVLLKQANVWSLVNKVASVRESFTSCPSPCISSSISGPRHGQIFGKDS